MKRESRRKEYTIVKWWCVKEKEKNVKFSVYEAHFDGNSIEYY